MSDMEDRMHTGEMYLPHDEQILARQFDCLERLYDFNQTRPHELDRRAELLHDMFRATTNTPTMPVVMAINVLAMNAFCMNA